MTILPIATNSAPTPVKGASGDAPMTRTDTAAQTGNTAASQSNTPGNDPTAEPFASLLARQIGQTGLPAPKSPQIPAADDSTKNPASDAASAAQKDKDQTAPVNAATGDQAGSVAALMLQIAVPQSVATSAGKQTAAVSTLRAAPASTADRGVSKLAAGNDSLAPATNDTVLLPLTAGEITKTPVKNSKSEATLLTVNNTDQTAVSAKSANLSLPLHTANGTARNETAISGIFSQTGHSEQKEAAPGSTAVVMPNIQGSSAPANNAQAVTSPIGSSAWPNEFSQKITWMSNQQNHSAELHLNPPDLGPLNVVLKMSDNQLTVQFTSAHSAVRDAVENALPKLREVLADNQIMLGNATVSDQPPRDRNGGGNMNQGSGNAPSRGIPSINARSNPLSPVTAQSTAVRRHNGILDTFA